MEQLIAHFICTNTIALSEVAFSNLHLLALLQEKNDCHPIFWRLLKRSNISTSCFWWQKDLKNNYLAIFLGVFFLIVLFFIQNALWRETWVSFCLYTWVWSLAAAQRTGAAHREPERTYHELYLRRKVLSKFLPASLYRNRTYRNDESFFFLKLQTAAH